jgi:hypothetical protein
MRRTVLRMDPGEPGGGSSIAGELARFREDQR